MASERDMNSTLSEAGRRRAARMRNELIDDMRRLHRRRRKRRHAAAAVLLLALVGGWWLMQTSQPAAPPGSPPIPAPRIAHGPSEPSPDQQVPAPSGDVTIAIVDASPPTRIESIKGDPAVLDRYRAHDRPLEYVTYLSDEQLVKELAAIGEPVSVVRLPDRVLLVRAEASSRQNAQ